MDIYTNAWIFQDDATTTGNGNTFKSGRNDQLTAYVKNTNVTYEVVFEGCNSEATPTWYAIPAIKLPDLTTVTSTTADGAFVINLAHFAGVRCRISSISGGGSLRVTGRAVNLGGSATTNIPTNLNATITTPIQTAFLHGTSTSIGTTSTLIDSTKNLEVDSLNTKTIKFSVDNTEYIRTITSSIGDTIGFADTQLAIPASVTVTGSTGGSMVINCKTAGVSGNVYSIILVAGTGISQQGTVSFADNLLTITSPTNVDGDPDQIMPGNVESIINNTPELAALFVVGTYQAGFPLDILSEPVPFAGGSEDAIVGSGVSYVVF